MHTYVNKVNNFNQNSKVMTTKSTKEKLFSSPFLKIKSEKKSCSKVAIIGSGKTASSIAFSLLVKEISDHVVLVDKNEDQLKAELQDFQYGSSFFRSNPQIEASSDYSTTSKAKVVVFAIDVNKIEGEDYTEFLQRNVDVYKKIVPNVIQYCSDAVFIIVSLTCDILACSILTLTLNSKICNFFY